MARTRSKRKLILDRLERNLLCHNECIRRLEEVMGFYAEGEETYPTQYLKLMAMIEQLLKTEIAVLQLYDTFMKEAKP